MDATVRESGEVVVAELHSADYMASTIGQYEKTIRALAKYTEERGGVYSPGSGAEFSSMTISPRTGRFSWLASARERQLRRWARGYLNGLGMFLVDRLRANTGPGSDPRPTVAGLT